MARIDPVPSSSGPGPRQRKGGKGEKSKIQLPEDDMTPFIRPSEITGGAVPQPQRKQKPLVDLSVDDLRAAGVTFTDADGGTLPGFEGLEGVRIPRVVVDPVTGEKKFMREGEEEEEEGEYEEYEGEYEEEEEAEVDNRTAEERAVEEFWDEFFDSMVYTIPFSFLFLLLDILSNQSYAVDRTKSYYMKNYAFALLTIGVLCFYTNRHIATSKLCQFLTTVAGIGSSIRVIWLINKSSYLTVMQQGPAFGTIWIISIVMLPLSRALFALAVWYGWVRWSGFSLQP